MKVQIKAGFGKLKEVRISITDKEILLLQSLNSNALGGQTDEVLVKADNGVSVVFEREDEI